MPKALDITGERFGSLVALECVIRDERRQWLFKCDCGREVVRRSDTVINGYVQGCEICHTKPIRTAKLPSRTRDEQSVRNSWFCMRARCNNSNHPSYKNYGGRGITICERWNDFHTFEKDMGPKPTLEHTLERVNTNGNYEPNNCRWATRMEQRHNWR